jgi:adenylate cyclase
MSPRSQAEVSANAVAATAVSDQLARILNSPRFTSSARLCRFLTHIVNRTIHGDLDSLKEFSIAMEVFDRTSKYDPNIDAIVRVQARRLRAKLEEYYEGTGRNDPVLIALRPGSYVPIFRWLDPQLRNQAQEIGGTIESGAASVAVLPFVNMSSDPEHRTYEEHQFRIDGTFKFSIHNFEISDHNMYVSARPVICTA